jgi:uncharacterized oligopeptide transporter (OPT) family protein
MNHEARTTAEPAASGQTDYEVESRRWLAEVYQGDRVRQLSVRSIVTGMIMGGVMSVSNLYVGLKTGWGLGVTITSCIMAFAVFKMLEGIFPSIRKDPFTILENYTMSSATSAAAFITSSGLSYAIPAYYMIQINLGNDPRLPVWQLMAWLAAVSCLGVFVAIPMKRQMINIEKLPFPDGIATAETLRSLHTAGAAAMTKARRLFWAMGLGGLIGLWKEIGDLGGYIANHLGFSAAAQRLVGMTLPDFAPFVPMEWARNLLKRNAIGWDCSSLMLAAGAIMGLRVGLSMLFGVFVFYFILGNWVLDAGIVAKEGFGSKGITGWTLWPGAAMLASSGITNLVLNWPIIVRAIQGIGKVLSGKQRDSDPLAHVEVPASWFMVGTLLSGIACIELGHSMFGVSRLMGLVAVLLAFLLSLIACRASGETNITPIGAMGKIAQLTFAVLAPGNITTNLMTANITGGSASHSADLLGDLKSGYLLGGNPRAQTISQLFGVLAGVLVCVPVFSIIVEPSELGTDKFPVPSAKIWQGIAEVLAEGFGKLPTHALTAIYIAAGLGVLMTIIDAKLPKISRWMPSATALGICAAIHPTNSIAMGVGSILAWLVSRGKPSRHDDYTLPIASGFLAGEPLVAVLSSLCTKLPEVLSNMWASLHG